VWYEVAVPRELSNVLVLDASYSIIGAPIGFGGVARLYVGNRKALLLLAWWRISLLHELTTAAGSDG
jgi:hypothetical protein